MVLSILKPLMVNATNEKANVAVSIFCQMRLIQTENYDAVAELFNDPETDGVRRGRIYKYIDANTHLFN